MLLLLLLLLLLLMLKLGIFKQNWQQLLNIFINQRKAKYDFDYTEL